jgi:hypothetical protein
VEAQHPGTRALRPEPLGHHLVPNSSSRPILAISSKKSLCALKKKLVEDEIVHVHPRVDRVLNVLDPVAESEREF